MKQALLPLTSILVRRWTLKVGLVRLVGHQATGQAQASAVHDIECKDHELWCHINLSQLHDADSDANMTQLGQPTMKPSIAFEQMRLDIRKITGRFPVRNPRVFGSVLHGDDIDGSDLDLLVDPLPETTLFDLGGLRGELEDLLGVPVDIRTPGGLPSKFRAVVVAEAEPV